MHMQQNQSNNEQSQKDILAEIDKRLRELNDKNHRFTQPIMQKYPLLFAFTVTFALVAILHGFELVVQRIPFIQQYPITLIVIGIILLFITGRLYTSFHPK